MRLLILPVGQSIDYDYALKTEVDLETVLSLSLLLGVVGVGMWRWRKGEKWWMLVAFWFFVPLLVTSSLVPIRDVIYEHRMYLSVMSFVILVVFLLQKKSEYLKYAWGLVAVLAMMSFSRNFVWASELKLWEDAWRKGPGKARTNKNYGYVLTTVGKLDEGIALLEKAVTLKTDDQHYFITLGSAYLQKQEWEKAREAFEKAVELEPGKEDGWNNLGVALFQLKDYAGSKVAFEKSIEVKSDFYMAWLGLGGAEMNLGNIEESRVALERAIELKPRKSEGYNNLLTLYIRIENWPKAWETVGQWEAVEPTNELVRLKKQAILEKLR